MLDTHVGGHCGKNSQTPKIVFTSKQKMRDAANSVELNIDYSNMKSSTGGSTTTTQDEDEVENPWAKAEIGSSRSTHPPGGCFKRF